MANLQCSCGQELVAVDENNNFWAPVSKPYEVCILNHWHKPVEYQDPEDILPSIY